MPFDLPFPVYPHQALSDTSIVQERSIDPAYTWIQPITKVPELAALVTAENQIEKFGRMPEGWDGYGALPISIVTKHNSLEALRGVSVYPPAPEITPNSNGTLSFEWETELGVAHLELGQTRLSFYVNLVSGDPVFLDASCDDLLIASLNIGFLVSIKLFPMRYAMASVTDIHLAAHVSTAY